MMSHGHALPLFVHRISLPKILLYFCFQKPSPATTYSDANDYFLCEAFRHEFARYLRAQTKTNPYFLVFSKETKIDKIMQSTKFRIDYNETTEQPEIRIIFNTASEDVLDKLIRRFHELATTRLRKVVSSKNDYTNGTSEIVLSIIDL